MPALPTTADPLVRVIAPARGWLPIRFDEIWAYRELLYFLVWRDVKVRYKQTALGIVWAIAQPVFLMVVFTLVFSRLGRLPSDGLPYPVFAFAALLPWQLFAFALAESSHSVVANQRLVSKVYFPRLIVPIASVCVGLVDFLISFVILLALMAYYGLTPGPAVLTVPLWTLLAVLTALSVGLWLAALNVRYRDIRYTLPLLTQVWLLATPVAYSLSLVSPEWRPWYALNPMVGVVETFRWALLGQASFPSFVWISAAATLLLLTGGLFYFRRTERTFADLI
jgi:lipopolysaccharide transport system permease protein